MEVVAARDAEALRAFDEAVAAESPALRRLIETSVSPEAVVLVPAFALEDGELQPEGRELVALPDHEEAQLIERLESERAQGARYLAVPAGSGWLASRPALREHLQRHYALAVREHSVGAVYSLFG